MKKLTSVLAVIAFLLSFQNCGKPFSPTNSPANSLSNLATTLMTCPGGTHFGSLIIDQNTEITESCIVDGNLSVKNSAKFLIDYSAQANNKFVVRGNVTLEASSGLLVNGRAGDEDLFVVANNYSQQRSITASGSSTFSLKQIEFRTQETIAVANGSVGMIYQGNDSSKMIIENSTLNLQSAWMLAYFNDNSNLDVVDSQGLPSENYIHDSTIVKISGPTTQTGMWLDAKGAVGTITIPDVNAPFSWKIGKNHGLNVGWLFEVDNSNPGMGIEIRQGTNLEIHGNGASAPVNGELKIGYFIDDATETLSGLNVGIQNNVVSPRLKLIDVQLGPIAWQIYAGDNAVVNINNSKINEIGISGPNSEVIVTGSILQFAALGAMAPGCELTIQNSEIWNQSIEADGTAQINITGSHIYGSLFHARAASTAITITNSVFHANPSGCSYATMVNSTTGQPLCNPFRPAGMPSKTGPGQVTCTTTSGCSF